MISLDKNSDMGEELTSMLQSLVGYIGAIALFIGGIAMYIDLPVIGRVSCLYCPTPSGIVYLIIAAISAYIVYIKQNKLLYLTGGVACALIAWDIYSATSLGYIVQMVFGSGLTASMGGQVDPQIAAMMENSGFNIPTAWIILAGGAFLLILTPQFETDKKRKPGSPREENLKERMNELDKIIKMYRNGDISKQEFSALKEELIGKDNKK